MTKEIRLNAFAMNCVAHQSPGLWTHPRDRTLGYNRLPYWLDLAKTLERGRFDGLFLADVLGVYDVYGNSPDAALRNAAQTPANEPLMLIPAMAAVTQHLGFGVTSDPRSCAESPRAVARLNAGLLPEFVAPVLLLASFIPRAMPLPANALSR